MPLTLPYRAFLEGNRIANRTDLVSVYLPIEAYGVICAEAESNIRPVTDDAAPLGISADVWIEPLSGRAQMASDPDAILKRIKVEQPETWAEIELKADENFRDGAA